MPKDTNHGDGEPKPLAVDLCSGLGGWAEGLEAEGFHVRRYDLYDMFEECGVPKPDGLDLVLRDVLTIHGSELADADLIVASPPCQEYSYMAMPWSLAKAKAARIRADETGAELARLNALFNACFRIQRECNEARAAKGLPPVPMVVENVKGAQPWVGRSVYNFGSFHLWGDVPALMPSPRSREVRAPGLGTRWVHPSDPRHTPGLDFTRLAARSEDDGLKNPGFRFGGSGKSFQTESVERHLQAFCAADDGRKQKGSGRERFAGEGTISGSTSSKSSARKAASAKIAKIPERLARHIARTYLPTPGNPNPTGQEIAEDFWNYALTRSLEQSLFD